MYAMMCKGKHAKYEEQRGRKWCKGRNGENVECQKGHKFLSHLELGTCTINFNADVKRFGHTFEVAFYVKHKKYTSF
jgi:hypothetical protein